MIDYQMNKTWWSAALMVALLCLTDGRVQAETNEQAEECSDDGKIENVIPSIGFATFEEWVKNVLQQGTDSPDKQGFISVEELKRLMNGGKVVLVDVRKPERYAALRIPGSINIGENRLSGKTFLKRKTVVLIDEGFTVFKMQALSQHLQQEGFDDIRVLAGGLVAWRNANEELLGDLHEQKRLNYITPRQLYLEHQLSDVIVVNFSEVGSMHTKGNSKIPMHELLLKQEKSIVPAKNRIVIATDDGLGYEPLEHAISKLRWPQVFYLKGGKQAYREYLKAQWAIWNRNGEKQGNKFTCGRRKR